ncbi:MAG: amidohydrolase family protein [Acetobacteraceae bacterium]
MTPLPLDCDIHPTLPNLAALVPYLDPHWREQITARGPDALDSISYPKNAPLTAHEWAERDHRFRASIVLLTQNPLRAAAEIERVVPDRRFAQALMLANDTRPLGKQLSWPIYEAAARNRLPIGIHAGSTYRQAVTGVGSPSHFIEDYGAQAQSFQAQPARLIAAGVLVKFPDLAVVFIEPWLPIVLWRFTKFWQGLRPDVPWVATPPADIVRAHVTLHLAADRRIGRS